MDFPNRLKKLRIERNLTQEQLGNKINVTKVSISGYENGNRTPDMETLQKIADTLEVSIDYLLGRSDDPSPHGTSTEGLAFFGGTDEELTEDEKEHLKESLEQFRKLKAKFLAERDKSNN
jgi:transcriptional regulator with XRE-family HTH domain